MLNSIVCIKQSTTFISCSVARFTLRLTLQDLKLNKKNCAYTLSSAQTAKAIIVRRGSHWGESPQNGLGDERTCGTTLASAYVLRHLSAAWSQLQMKEKKSKWK